MIRVGDTAGNIGVGNINVNMEANRDRNGSRNREAHGYALWGPKRVIPAYGWRFAICCIFEGRERNLVPVLLSSNITLDLFVGHDFPLVGEMCLTCAAICSLVDYLKIEERSNMIYLKGHECSATNLVLMPVADSSNSCPVTPDACQEEAINGTNLID
ncbi:hypothetical protein P154DRAFT_317287 [Amniculicola lignicola CBS 123094]|uniref:Uncharacterized protein n=1 Tax=Amniculicola lignicola CBS 123094 TaxID=1392246 RepID=A0A6A5WX62_9PLEO|nr:hypothetical protein P154DRAFT_317287 [Amniculicola lignicola CBS 123094]